MANPEHLAILKQGVESWNRWREQNPLIRPNLRKAELGKMDLRGAKLWQADIARATLCGAELTETDLRMANLRAACLYQVDAQRAKLKGARLFQTDLRMANMSGTDLRGVNLNKANLSRAVCRDADFEGASLIGTNLENANLTGIRIYGISAWDVKLDGAIQEDLVITRGGQSVITVDDLEVAQFIYLLLNNQKVRKVIETITSKVVLILGRFSPERKPVLDAIREELRRRDYLPVLFDFEKPVSRDLTETVSTLAHMARFVIADITDAKSIPQELERLVPGLPSVPVQPLLLASQQEYGMFEHLQRYPWVLEPLLYDDQQKLLAKIKNTVIAPAEAKAKEQMAPRLGTSKNRSA